MKKSNTDNKYPDKYLDFTRPNSNFVKDTEKSGKLPEGLHLKENLSSIFFNQKNQEKNQENLQKKFFDKAMQIAINPKTDSEIRNFLDQSSKNNQECRILIVDDQKFNLAILASKIRKNFPEIICNIVKSGEKAIAAAKKIRYDLILMDIQMPQMSGIEAARQIKSFDSSIKIIALTALGRYSFLQDDQKISPETNLSQIFDGYLSKIAGENFLLRVLNKWLPTSRKKHSKPQSHEDYFSLLKGKKIMIAEDSEIDRMVLIKFLSKFEPEIVVAKSGEEVLQEYRKSLNEKGISNFDLIICDISMPEMDGDQAVLELRRIELKNKIPFFEELPVIGLSGDDNSENISGYLRCGISDYFLKGKDFNKLLEIIADCLRAEDESNSKNSKNSNDNQELTSETAEDLTDLSFDILSESDLKVNLSEVVKHPRTVFSENARSEKHNSDILDKPEKESDSNKATDKNPYQIQELDPDFSSSKPINSSLTSDFSESKPRNIQKNSDFVGSNDITDSSTSSTSSFSLDQDESQNLKNPDSFQEENIAQKIKNLLLRKFKLTNQPKPQEIEQPQESSADLNQSHNSSETAANLTESEAKTETEISGEISGEDEVNQSEYDSPSSAKNHQKQEEEQEDCYKEETKREGLKTESASTEDEKPKFFRKKSLILPSELPSPILHNRHPNPVKEIEKEDEIAPFEKGGKLDLENFEEIEILNQNLLEEFGTKEREVMIKLFLESCNFAISSVEYAIERKSLRDLMFSIHSMKGICSNIGAERCLSYLRVAEPILQKEPQNSEIWIKNFKEIYADLREKLEDLICD